MEYGGYIDISELLISEVGDTSLIPIENWQESQALEWASQFDKDIVKGAKDVNTCALIGRLTKDPELRTTPGGTAVTSFTIAVNRRYSKDVTDFIDVIAWRNTAEFICRYFTKGQRIAVTGSMQTRVWEDSNGNKHKAVEIVADTVEFVDAKKKAEVVQDEDGDEYEQVEFSTDDDLPF